MCFFFFPHLKYKQPHGRGGSKSTYQVSGLLSNQTYSTLILDLGPNTGKGTREHLKYLCTDVHGIGNILNIAISNTKA